MMAEFDERKWTESFGEGVSRTLAAGEPLFRQGEPAQSIFLIHAGRVRMIRHLVAGDRITIHTGRAGQLFAEGALFSEFYHCDAVAAEAADVRAFAKASFLAAIRASPEILLFLLERVTLQLHHTRAMLELRNVRSARERVLMHLQLSATRESKGGAVTFDRPLTEVASEIGLTQEAYYRALAALQEQGRIARAGRVIRLIS
jgi:CRP-like cAMP-binding protein